MKFLLTKKQHMTQFYSQEGIVSPATILIALPNTVTDVRTQERDGYTAVQLAAFEKSIKNTSKAVLGHTGGKAFETTKEFRVEETELKKGDTIAVNIFTPGEIISATGISKGKGFQGVVKRHGFKGGPRSHGQKHSEREPGSIGGGLRSRVPQGMRMAGRMGGDRITVRNLTVLAVDTENGFLLVKGAVPGKRGDSIEIRSV